MQASIRPVGAPTAPLGVIATPGPSSATVSWSPPTLDGGAALSSYVVAVGRSGPSCTWTSGPLTCEITGLTPGRSVSVTVRAVSANGTGAASDPIAVTPGT